MRKPTLLWGILAAAGLAACTDATGPGNASGADRDEVVAALDASGWFSEGIGADGATLDLSRVPGFALNLSTVAVQDTVPLVRRWGRRRGRPTAREITVNVANDTAVVSAVVTFDGAFLLDRTDDGQVNPTEKPLQEQAVHHAVLVRRAETDTAGRHWQVAQLSSWEWRMTDLARRTVSVTRVEIRVNGASKIVVEDPAQPYDVNTQIPRLEVGDEVQVIADVTNTTGTGNEPATFVFLHLYHANPLGRGWIRVPMVANDQGQFVRTWTVRFAGRERIGVDAIDSQTFNTDTDDDYRANGWGIPYRIE